MDQNKNTNRKKIKNQPLPSSSKSHGYKDLNASAYVDIDKYGLSSKSVILPQEYYLSNAEPSLKYSSKNAEGIMYSDDDEEDDELVHIPRTATDHLDAADDVDIEFESSGEDVTQSSCLSSTGSSLSNSQDSINNSFIMQSLHHGSDDMLAQSDAFNTFHISANRRKSTGDTSSKQQRQYKKQERSVSPSDIDLGTSLSSLIKNPLLHGKNISGTTPHNVSKSVGSSSSKSSSDKLKRPNVNNMHSGISQQESSLIYSTFVTSPTAKCKPTAFPSNSSSSSSPRHPYVPLTVDPTLKATPYNNSFDKSSTKNKGVSSQTYNDQEMKSVDRFDLELQNNKLSKTKSLDSSSSRSTVSSASESTVSHYSAPSVMGGTDGTYTKSSGTLVDSSSSNDSAATAIAFDEYSKRRRRLTEGENRYSMSRSRRSSRTTTPSSLRHSHSSSDDHYSKEAIDNFEENANKGETKLFIPAISQPLKSSTGSSTGSRSRAKVTSNNSKKTINNLRPSSTSPSRQTQKKSGVYGSKDSSREEYNRKIPTSPSVRSPNRRPSASPASIERRKNADANSSSSGGGPFSNVDISTVSLAAAGISLVAGLSFSAGYALGKRSSVHLTVSS